MNTWVSAMNMMPQSDGEERRLAALSKLGILDTERDASFDRISRLAAILLNVPVAHISLIDRSREWLKSATGSPRIEIPRDSSICAWTIRQDGPMIVHDLRADDRFRHLPYVADEPNYRFYAGAPLRDCDGYNLGALYCLDYRPRTLDQDQISGLEDLAKLVLDAIELRMVATTDALTGSATRRTFLQSAERSFVRAQRYREQLACLVIDVDGIESVNETHGYAAGDRVLQSFGSLCRKELRSSDSFGRLGGGEFGLLVKESETAVIGLAERLREGLARMSFTGRDGSFRATASIGLSSLRKDTSNVKMLLEDAYSGLRKAKSLGQNRTCAGNNASVETDGGTVHAKGVSRPLEFRAEHQAKPDEKLGPIVVIEDDLSLNIAIVEDLDGLGYETISVLHIASLRTTGLSKATFVILDISLNGADAVDVLQLLQLKGYGGPVQIVSGHRQDILEEVKSLGERKGMRMLPVMQKPVDLQSISSVVASFHDKRMVPDVPAAVIKPVAVVRPLTDIDLGDALKAGWVDIWYQPKYSVSTGLLAGVECLSRIRHPTLGLLLPGAFLPGASLADMGALTEFVVARACADWSDFKSFVAPPRLAVNVPGPLLTDLPLAQHLREHAPSDSAWPGLVFEITEEDALKDLESARDIATQLRIYGVELSIDDFGLGYSSLARLKEIPFREIKIDRSLVDGCATDAINGPLCRSIVELAHSFSAAAVAEGVERHEDFEFLQSVGCDMVQGFLFKRPISKEQLLVELTRADNLNNTTLSMIDMSLAGITSAARNTSSPLRLSGEDAARFAIGAISPAPAASRRLR